MALITVISSIAIDYATFTWSGMGADDHGAGVEVFRYTDKTFQTYLTDSGQFGTSSLHIEGSNDSNDGEDGHWRFIHDPQGNDMQLSATSGQFEVLLENPRWVRPQAGTGTGSLMSVNLFAAKVK